MRLNGYSFFQCSRKLVTSVSRLSKPISFAETPYGANSTKQVSLIKYLADLLLLNQTWCCINLF